MKKLPYRVQTTTGDMFDIEFPLHDDTASAVRVEQLVSAVLETLASDIAIAGETSNGDVLQALAMAMAVRARMIHAAPATTEKLSTDLLQTALDAVAGSARRTPQVGHA